MRLGISWKDFGVIVGTKVDVEWPFLCYERSQMKKTQDCMLSQPRCADLHDSLETAGVVPRYIALPALPVQCIATLILKIPSHSTTYLDRK